MVLANKRSPLLDGGHSTKIGGVWNLKHEIISPKLYVLLLKNELIGETGMYLKSFYNHIKMCLNVVNRLLKDILLSYQSIKRLKFYVVFQKVASDLLEHCGFVDPQNLSCRSPYQTQNYLDHIQINIVRVNPQIDRDVVVQLSVRYQQKTNISDYSS